MTGVRGLIAALLLALAAGPAWAVQPDEILDDPALETRARAISKELRCLVCRNENIDDSNAGLARDLRLLVRERLVAGDSDEATIGYIVDRYGEFVLLRPVFSLGNAALWLGGPLLLILGGLASWRFVAASRPGAAAPAGAGGDGDGGGGVVDGGGGARGAAARGGLSAAEQARLDVLLRD